MPRIVKKPPSNNSKVDPEIAVRPMPSVSALSPTSSTRPLSFDNAQPSKILIAKFPYKPPASRRSEELEYKKGDAFTVVEAKKEDEWWRVVNANGIEGLVAQNYMMVPAPSGSSAGLYGPGELPAKMVFDFDAETSTDMSARQGEIIIVKERDPTGWWLCRNLEGKEGYLPENFLTLDVDSKLDNPALTTVDEDYVVDFDFEGLDSSELSAKVGDIVQVTKKDDESMWYYGEIKSTKIAGWLPSSYLTKI